MKAQKKKRLIVVLGMHRSGTSAIARGLQVLRVPLGDRLMPPNALDNPTGFWEDLDLYALNIEMLNAIGSDWDRLSAIGKDEVEALRKSGFFLRGAELLRAKMGARPRFGFKDPRVAKLLPFWKRVFAHCRYDASYVLSLRHPMSVARSLEKRDGFAAEKSYLLWLDHVLEAANVLIMSKGRNAAMEFRALNVRQLHTILAQYQPQQQQGASGASGAGGGFAVVPPGLSKSSQEIVERIERAKVREHLLH